ncbi:hypothetical protein ADK41_06620 [Streptomyces caelestis]|uniref:Uncharacterized protein n=1 Tax=Streptomyces caelestis TaxID=36816 RepID=A0A0N0S6D5_9ACTN|nr:hypothetical protein ADK41_06620 [Streptomyces caelestis]
MNGAHRPRRPELRHSTEPAEPVGYIPMTATTAAVLRPGAEPVPDPRSSRRVRRLRADATAPT